MEWINEWMNEDRVSKCNWIVWVRDKKILGGNYKK